MGIAQILALVAQLVPVARNVIDTLHGAQNTPNPTSDVLDIIASLTPVAAQLMSTIDTIKNQTEAQYPQVWAAVRDDYASASSKFDQLKAASQQ